MTKAEAKAALEEIGQRQTAARLAKDYALVLAIEPERQAFLAAHPYLAMKAAAGSGSRAGRRQYAELRAQDQARRAISKQWRAGA